MTPFLKKLALVSATLFVIGCKDSGGSGGKFHPEEHQGQEELTFTRTAQSGLDSLANLSKAIFITEEYQETEEYTDYEEECHTSHERVCHTEQDCHQGPGGRECRWVPGDRQCRWLPGERECRRIPGERQCRQERVCEPDRGERNCEVVRECGRNARGEEICKDRKVCHDSPPRERCETREVCEPGRDREECHESPGRQVCEDTPGRQVCEDTPGRQICTPREVCSSEPRQVCESIPVRKTRVVTRTRETFSHYEYTDIVVRFPFGSELQGEETESFHLKIEANDEITLTQLSGPNVYRVVANDRVGGQVTITLDFASQDGDENSDLQDLVLVRTKQTASFNFTDHGHRARTKTSYALVLKDRAHEVVARAKGANSGSELVQRLAIAKKLASGVYHYELSVSRDAQGSQGDQSFTKVGTIQLK